MKKLSVFYLLLVLLCPLLLSCSDDDVSTSEYINPMKNNPVNEVEWLNEQKNSLKTGIDKTIDTSKELDQSAWAIIKMYSLDGNNYYQIIYSIFPQGDYFGDSLLDEQGELIGVGIAGEMSTEFWEKYNPPYVEFMKKAKFVDVLWEYRTR